MRYVLALVAMGWLAGCSPPNDRAPEPAQTASVTATSAATEPAPPGVPEGAIATGELVGEWRVAGVDGRAVNLPHAITVSIDATTIRYASHCVSGVWTYRAAGPSIVTRQVPQAMCDRGRYREERALDAVFSAPGAIRRTAGSGIDIAGGGHSITLFSQ